MLILLEISGRCYFQLDCKYRKIATRHFDGHFDSYFFFLVLTFSGFYIEFYRVAG